MKLRAINKLQLEAVNKLKSSPETRLLVEIVDSALKEADLALRTADAENFKKMQGIAIALQDVSSFLTSPPTKIE